jgi:hypothetical protein
VTLPVPIVLYPGPVGYALLLPDGRPFWAPNPDVAADRCYVFGLEAGWPGAAFHLDLLVGVSN